MAKTYPYNVKNSLFSDSIKVKWGINNSVEIKAQQSKLCLVTTDTDPHIDIQAANAADLNNPVKISSPFEYKLKRKNDTLQVKLWAGTDQGTGSQASGEAESEEPETTVEVGAPQ